MGRVGTLLYFSFPSHTHTHVELMLPYLSSRRMHVSSRKTQLSMYIQELRTRRPPCGISSFTAHKPEAFCLMGRFGGTDYNSIRMPMIAGIDCGRGEKHTTMWLRCFWAFDAYHVVGALWIPGELMSSGPQASWRIRAFCVCICKRTLFGFLEGCGGVSGALRGRSENAPT